VLGAIATLEKVLLRAVQFLFGSTDVLITVVFASLLPERVETLVPFDRTYGGAVDIRPGQALPIWQAWRALSLGKLWRLVKLFTIGALMIGTMTFAMSFAAHSTLGLDLFPDLTASVNHQNKHPL